jgi:hypothetical protein
MNIFIASDFFLAFLSDTHHVMQIFLSRKCEYNKTFFTLTIDNSIFPKSVKRKLQALQFNLFTNKVKLAPVLHMSQLVINSDTT